MKPIAATRDLFVTRLYDGSLASEAGFDEFNAGLEAACRMLAAEDRAGRVWSRSNGYGGYTSYASLDDLTSRASVFADLKRRLDRRAAEFGKTLAFDLRRGGRLKLNSLWVNVLRKGAPHSGHIHPASVISGTIYVVASPGSGALRLEDPRLPLMMAAPPRLLDAPEMLKTFVTLQPSPGAIFMWESWLRHEVLPGAARSQRISISFNYGWP